jgi:uncharacterized membrane protein
MLNWAASSQNDDGNNISKIENREVEDVVTVPKQCPVPCTTATLFVSLLSGIIAVVSQITMAEKYLMMSFFILLTSCCVTVIACVTNKCHRQEDIMRKCTTVFKKVRLFHLLICFLEWTLSPHLHLFSLDHGNSCCASASLY